MCDSTERRFQCRDATSLSRNLGFGRLRSFEQISNEVVAQFPRKVSEEPPRIVFLLVDGQPHSQSELGVILEE